MALIFKNCRIMLTPSVDPTFKLIRQAILAKAANEFMFKEDEFHLLFDKKMKIGGKKSERESVNRGKQ